MIFKPIRNLLGRLRGTVGNRRRAPRYDARINFSAALLDGAAGREGAQPPQPRTLVGHTRNLSETGLGLIVPSLRLGTSRLDKVDVVTLRLMLDPSRGPVEIQVAPVRSYPLGADDKETGYFIGVMITQLSDDARAQLVKYLRGLPSPR
ncbi:MAG: PilZ domain-containing protein [Pyrinomonadaceae bacterium]